jgi:hypothetical protein
VSSVFDSWKRDPDRRRQAREIQQIENRWLPSRRAAGDIRARRAQNPLDHRTAKVIRPSATRDRI